jgi:mono/diheme cytochrome c family protein
MVLGVGLVVWVGTALAAGDVAAGKTIYDKKCAMCHGKNGEGNPGMAKMLKVELRQLGSAEVQAQNDAQMRKIVLEGSGKMKPLKLSEEELGNVSAYVRSLAKK